MVSEVLADVSRTRPAWPGRRARRYPAIAGDTVKEWSRHSGSGYRAAYDAITRVCGQGQPGSDVFAQLAGQLRRAVPFRTGGWLRLDPMTMLPMPGLLLQAGHDRARKIIHNEYFETDVVKFRDLARQPVPVQTLWRATGGEPDRRTRFHRHQKPGRPGTARTETVPARI